ncbi:MAG: AarF/ABC1/UbiB kinase family protein [Cryobacterium sp.]|nr:AarF/ABC1/UbiB kinase family protein [Cryobacterium sp.]
MTKPRLLRARYRRIVGFASRTILGEWWFEVVLPRIGFGWLSRKTRPDRTRRIARRFQRLAIDLGGLMIKVGQFMSSRLDVLPPEITSELERLQDEVPAADFDSVRSLAEADLGLRLENVFPYFEEKPLAAASLGQVHRARLSEEDAKIAGFENVVVKIQRPGVDEIVKVDLDALKTIVRRLEKVKLISDRVNLKELLREFATVSMQEIDYLHEGANAERFAEGFRDNPLVSNPRVAWERTTRRVLTLSDVSAIKINDRAALLKAGISPEKVAEALASAMFDQLFVNGFFHADPHPGNMFVTPSNRNERSTGADSWKLTFVDFGMMGEVPESLKSGMRKLVIGVASRDSKKLVEGFKEMGMLVTNTDSSRLESVLTELFSRFGGMGFAQLREVDSREFKDFAEDFGAVMREMPFQMPENLLLIIRAISVTSGVSTSLNPRFNIWTAIEPYAEILAKDEIGATAKSLLEDAVSTARTLYGLPKKLEELSNLIQQDRLAIRTPGLDQRIKSLEILASRVLGSVIFAGMLLGGIFLKETDPIGGWTLFGTAVIPLAYAVFAGVRQK